MDKPSFRLEDIRLEDLGDNIAPKVLAEETVGKHNPKITDARHCSSEDAEDHTPDERYCDKCGCDGYDYKCPCEVDEPSGGCTDYEMCGDF